MDVPMELSRIVITELGDHQVIFLREKGGDRTFPILIGIHEILAIDRRLKGKAAPRPMTHDLLASVIEALGGSIEKIVINDLQGHTFYARLHIRRGSETLEIDSRPSDAIALGAAFGTPIFVAEHVLDSVVNEPSSAEQRIEMLRNRMAALREQIEDLTARLADENYVSGAPEALIEQQRKQLQDMQTEFDAIQRVLKKFS